MYSARIVIYTHTTCEKVGTKELKTRCEAPYGREVREVRKEKANGKRVRVASEPSPKDLPFYCISVSGPYQTEADVSARVGKSIQWLDGVANSVSGQALRAPL